MVFENLLAEFWYGFVHFLSTDEMYDGLEDGIMLLLGLFSGYGKGKSFYELS